ncbi:bleomycin resistance protein [Dongia rigui]|uniref:Bleomycin resistance protein n=1 Tax=Dongia rigui TaxID=940149 RepID=A0ABU5DUQ8_9PROT|nr:VOC family protein [Dongia rigui]MDY0870680.1 VOC family protein [Dongia rigui]
MKPSEYPYAPLVPELICSDFARSRAFYVDLLGFRPAYERPEHSFAYLERGPIQIMIEQFSEEGSWATAEMVQPYGRGINLQIEIDDLDGLAAKIKRAGIAFYKEPVDCWYRVDDHESGQRQFLVQDPDGYLLRFCQNIGERPVT